MLGSRYKYDKLPLLNLNTLQINTKARIEKKVAENIYTFESVPCCVCSGNDFEPLSEKDRYGLYMPVCICKTCGLIQTNPRMTQEAYNEFYKSEYRMLYNAVEEPSATFFDGQVHQGRKIFRYLESNDILAKIPSGAVVLEVGCGAGGILQVFKQQGFQVIGLDLGGEDYLNYGRETHGLDLRMGTLADYDGSSPHLIIYSHVLEHILDTPAELALVRKILNPDGFAYFEMPGMRYLHRNLYLMDFMRVLQNAHTYHFTLTTTQNLLEQAGFKLVVGDESIRSVFVVGAIHENWTSEYRAMMTYLKRLEFARSLLPITPYEIVQILRKLLKLI